MGNSAAKPISGTLFLFVPCLLLFLLLTNLPHSALSLSMSNSGSKAVTGDESLMRPKAHGTCEAPVMDNLRWQVDREDADRICCFNRHYAEPSGYFEGMQAFLDEMAEAGAQGKEVTFYDSVSGRPLFIAPRGRTVAAFLSESRAHGWPSFRDDEVVWDSVRVLEDGEAVSTVGTHLGHNLPDRKGE